MFSGLNLAFFSVGRLRLEAEAESGDMSARKILTLREDSNFLLCTILWGNVSVNVLLALLSDSVFAGLGAFVFSTVGITFFGEIMPQAYFSRHAMRMGALLTPVIRFYQFLLYIVAKPSALILDGWIGPEGPSFLGERNLEIFLKKHIRDEASEIGAIEGRGALNFLSLDDRRMSTEGVNIAPESVMSFPCKLDLPVIPGPDDPGGKEFGEALAKIHWKWTIITNEEDEPMLVLETDRYVRELLSGEMDGDVYHHCHRPIIVTDPNQKLESILDKLVVEAEHGQDRVIDNDVILFWTPTQRRIVTGADILGRLMHGIVQSRPSNGEEKGKPRLLRKEEGRSVKTEAS